MPLPTVNYAQTYGQLGQQVGQLGAAIDETAAWAQLQGKLKDFRRFKKDFKEETLATIGNKWSPQQRKRFSAEIDLINDPNEFVEKSKAFEDQVLYYEQTGQSGSAPSWGHKADWYKARKGEEQATEFLGRALTPTVTQPQSVGGVPAQPPPAEGQLPVPPRVEKITPGGLQRVTPERFGRQALEELGPEAIADPRIAAAQKTLAAEEQRFETRREETLARMDEEFDQSMKRITTATGIGWRVGGHTAIFETKASQDRTKEKITALEKLGRDLNTRNPEKLQEAEMDAANLGVRADSREVAREIALAEEQNKRHDDYIQQIKDAMKLKEKAEKEKRQAQRQPKPKTVSPLHPARAESTLAGRMAQKIGQLFPAQYEVIQGEFGIPTLKLIKGQTPAPLVTDPGRMNVMAWVYFPQLAKAADIPQPTDAEMADMRAEVEGLQAPAPTPAPIGERPALETFRR